MDFSPNARLLTKFRFKQEHKNDRDILLTRGTCNHAIQTECRLSHAIRTISVVIVNVGEKRNYANRERRRGLNTQTAIDLIRSTGSTTTILTNW